jgi:hypothetical protein
MAGQERFRPYLGLLSEYERLQALRQFLDWVYATSALRERFIQDLYAALKALRMNEAVEWGKKDPVAFVEGLSPTQCQLLQLQARNRLEELLDPPQGKDIPLLSSPPRTLVRREAGVGKIFFVSAYKASDFLGDQHLTDLILLRFFDLLSGLNQEALMRCAICGNYTVRRHPRGKTYCSPNCRVKAAVAARKQSQEKPKTEKKKQPVSKRERKES